jgi:hypothetical protein
MFPSFTQVLADRMNAVWHELDFRPRTCPSHKSRLCTYNACFARLPGWFCQRVCVVITVVRQVHETALAFQNGVSWIAQGYWLMD